MNYHIEILIFFEKNALYFLGFGFNMSFIYCLISETIHSNFILKFITTELIYFFLYMIFVLVSINKESPNVIIINNFRELIQAVSNYIKNKKFPKSYLSHLEKLRN